MKEIKRKKTMDVLSIAELEIKGLCRVRGIFAHYTRKNNYIALKFESKPKKDKKTPLLGKEGKRLKDAGWFENVKTKPPRR